MLFLRLRSYCFSSISRETYNALTNWLTDARTLASPNIVIVLVGNKKDLDADREVTFMEASRFAQENGQHYVISDGHFPPKYLLSISPSPPPPPPNLSTFLPLLPLPRSSPLPSPPPLTDLFSWPLAPFSSFCHLCVTLCL